MIRKNETVYECLLPVGKSIHGRLTVVLHSQDIVEAYVHPSAVSFTLTFARWQPDGFMYRMRKRLGRACRMEQKRQFEATQAEWYDVKRGCVSLRSRAQSQNR